MYVLHEVLNNFIIKVDRVNSSVLEPKLNNITETTSQTAAKKKVVKFVNKKKSEHDY